MPFKPHTRRTGTLDLGAVIDRIRKADDALRAPDVLAAVGAALPRPRVFLSAFLLVARWPAYSAILGDEERALLASATALVRLFDDGPCAARRARVLLRVYARLSAAYKPRVVPRMQSALLLLHPGAAAPRPSGGDAAPARAAP